MKTKTISQKFFFHTLAAALTLVGMISAVPVLAQTCAAPLSLTTFGTYTGNSCGVNQISYVANGMLSMGGSEVVYRFGASPDQGNLIFNLSPNPASALSMSVCTGPCGSSSSCVALNQSDMAGGPFSVSFVAPAPAYYYLIIDAALITSPPAGCGTYSLQFSGPL